MLLADLTPKALVSALQHRHKRSLGQNFLIDENITRAIAREAAQFSPSHLLEIGPGAGALTLALLPLQKPYVALEKDTHCANFLRHHFSGAGLSVITGDALHEPLPDFCYEQGNRALLVSNLPYNVASQIYFRFIDEDVPLCGMVLMFQREVANRFVAKPGTKAYGILSVIGQYYHHIEHVMDVPPEAFKPAPKVMSSVLRFSPRHRLLPKEREQAFRTLVHAAFSQRRKTLANSLAGSGGRSKEAWLGVLESLGYPSTLRAENLSLADFLRLFETMF